MTTTGQPLAAVDLPFAPPVLRAVAAPIRRPKLPAVGLLVLGVLLVLGPIVGGLFSKVAAGNQMLDAFAPHMDADALARYDADLGILRGGTRGVDAIYSEQHLTDGRFPGLDKYRRQSPAIDDRAARLLDRVKAAEPDYRQAASIGGFDRIPFLIVVTGIVAIWGGCVLLTAGRGRAKPTVLVLALVSVALALFPFISNLDRGAHAGHRMLRSFTPLMTPVEVRQLQRDFVVIVEAVGVLDTSFRQVPQSGTAATEVATLIERWPKVSSDLASLVGTINDNVGNFESLQSLDRLTHSAGSSGLEVFPWVLAGVGAASAGLALASWPRRRKEAA